MTKAELQAQLDDLMERSVLLSQQNLHLKETNRLHERYLSLVETLARRPSYWGGGS